VDVIEVSFGVDTAFDLQAAQGGAVAVEQPVAHGWNFILGDAKKIAHIEKHTLHHQRPDLYRRRVNRVVQVNQERGDFHGRSTQRLRFPGAW